MQTKGVVCRGETGEVGAEGVYARDGNGRELGREAKAEGVEAAFEVGGGGGEAGVEAGGEVCP